VVFAAGYFIELIGVNRGVIFGEYRYGQGLGLKLWNTPLLIGMNWLMMVYLSGSVVSLMNLRVIPSILIASFIMLLYDVLMEQVASDLDMWYWANNTIPLQNYIAWFIIALIFHIGIKIVGIKTENKDCPVY
jgi:putative membrane protein